MKKRSPGGTAVRKVFYVDAKQDTWDMVITNLSDCIGAKLTTSQPEEITVERYEPSTRKGSSVYVLISGNCNYFLVGTMLMKCDLGFYSNIKKTNQFKFMKSATLTLDTYCYKNIILRLGSVTIKGVQKVIQRVGYLVDIEQTKLLEISMVSEASSRKIIKSLLENVPDNVRFLVDDTKLELFESPKVYSPNVMFERFNLSVKEYSEDHTMIQYFATMIQMKLLNK